jgi:hypothetical protein
MTTNASNAVGSLDSQRAPRVSGRVSFWVTQLAPFVVALAAYSVAHEVMSPTPIGDEPHYLISAQSLAFDGDLDLVNDYESPERTQTAAGGPLSPSLHAADYRDTGQLRPIRGIGMAVLLAPAVALDGLRGVRILMVLIAALVADQLFRLLRDLGFRRRWGILAWAAVALCYPMLVYCSQVYPELPGALLLLVALRVMVRWASSPLALAVASSAAALLVWLHVRFIPLSLGVFLGLAIAALRAARAPPDESTREPGLRGFLRAALGEAARYARIAARAWRTVTLPVAVPYVALLALFAAVSYHLYGSIHPSAPYRAFSDTTAGSGGWSFVYEFALADVLNPSHGWIPYVPVHWLGLAALGCLVLRWRWVAVACIAVPVGYEVFLSSLGPVFGWAFPARYLIVVIPFIAVPLALVIQQVRGARFVFFPLLAVSLVFATAAVADYRQLYPSSDRPRVFGARAAAGLYPITNASRFPTSYVLNPGEYGPNTGQLEDGHAVARPGDRPDGLVYGPFANLRRGTYEATFRLEASGAPPGSHVATIDVYSSLPDGVLARRELTAQELAPPMREVTVEFSNPDGGLIQTRVFYEGRGTVRAGRVEVVPQGAAGAQDFGRLPDWPKAFGWLIVTIVAGWLLVLGMRRAHSDAESGAGSASTTN